MTHVVTGACIQCKYTDCAAVCPIDDCFLEGPNFLVIDPAACIDCGVCIPECPVEAIVADFDTRPDLQKWLELNARLAERWVGNGITEKKDPLPTAEAMKDVKDKDALLDESPL